MAKKIPSRASTTDITCPDSVEKLHQAISARYSELSGRLQQVAQYVIDHPNDMAVETLAVIAERCHVQPSTIVRFAKEFGYGGASEMQRLFRDKLLEGRSSPSYQERMRGAKEAVTHERKEPLLGILKEITQQNIVALEHLHESVTEKEMHRIAELIDRAETVYVTARRRSFPVAAFIAYTLLRFGKRTVLIDGVAGLETIQSEIIDKRDLLIAISYKPYAAETVQFATRAAELKCKVVTITDSQFSPLANLSDVVLVANEAEISGFRSLASSSTLAQALLLGYAFRRQRATTDGAIKAR
jgi:DNA-binding MurR/RpiR family transcriptional regulator